jgi:hypothetical protein
MRNALKYVKSAFSLARSQNAAGRRPGARFLALPEYRIYLAAYEGDLTGANVFALMRAFFQQEPECMNYGVINDVRRHYGVIHDQDMIDHLKWIRTMRVAKGWIERPSIPVAFISRSSESGRGLVSVYASVVGGANACYLDTPQAAWQAVHGTDPIPDEVRRFFR